MQIDADIASGIGRVPSRLRAQGTRRLFGQQIDHPRREATLARHPNRDLCRRAVDDWVGEGRLIGPGHRRDRWPGIAGLALGTRHNKPARTTDIVIRMSAF